jgi:iron complex outermembrane recepter protein
MGRSNSFTQTQMMMKPTHKKLANAIAAMVGASVSLQALAQSSATSAAVPAPKVERIEVTGSNIRRVDAETTAPIQVITADEIRRSGRQTVTDLLRELPINATGGLTELTGSATFATGAASVSLRGLGSSATLVLLNGRRVAPYGLQDPNFGSSGGAVNLNAIPLDVIERIEILKDGASAIYGSEAIAGVVNIILRKDYKGALMGATVNANKDGDYGNATANMSFGFGDLAKDRYNVFFNAEAFRQESVLFRDAEAFLNRNEYRGGYNTGVVGSAYSPFLTFVRTNTATPTLEPGPNCPTANRSPAVINRNPFTPGGFVLVGGVSAGTGCLYDTFPFSEIVPKSSRESIFARGTFDLSASTQLFAELSYVHNNIYFRGAPSAVGQGQSGTINPSTLRIQPQPTTLPASHPNNPYGIPTLFRGRFDAVGPQDNEVDSDTTRALIGMKTAIGRFDVESGLLFNRTEQNVTNHNSLRYSQVIAGITGGGYNFANPFAGPVTPDTLRINAKDKGTSTFTIFDIKASGEIATLPGGSAGIAIGAEYRKEDRNQRPDAAKQVGEVFGRGISFAQSSRNVQTLFAELILPVLKNVEVQVAGRYDKYSDSGRSFTPKVSASWAALSSLKLRGSFAKGFRAPSLTESSPSASTGFFNGFVDPRRCIAGVTSAGCSTTAAAFIVPNAAIKAEKAETYSAGFVWEPTKDSSVSVDYFSIARRDEIGFLGLNDILINEGSSDPRFRDRVVRDVTNGGLGPAFAGDPGVITTVRSGFDNSGETRVRGLDIDARMRFGLGEYGRLTMAINATHYLYYAGNNTSEDPLESLKGFRNFPEWRAQLRGTWEVGSWTNAAGVNYLSGTKAFPQPALQSAQTQGQIANCGAITSFYLGRCQIPDYVTLDVSTEYRGFKNWRLNFAIRNLTNERPAFDPIARPFNTTWYQPQGINFVLGARYTFW